MRVLHISSARTFGDPERHIVCLCREMSRRGHEMFIALRPTAEWQESVAFLPPERILQVSIRNSFGMFSARSIARFVDRHGIEIIHAHEAKDYLAGSIIRRGAQNVRLVLTRHVARPLKPFHRYALRNVDAAIGLSTEATDLLRLTFAGKNISYAPPAIEIVDISPDDRALKRKIFREFHQIPEAATLVVAIGELSPVGGHRDLVLAAGEVIKKIPETYFVIAGDDRTPDVRHRRELRRLGKVLGLKDRILWLDGPDDAADILAASELFVSPMHSDTLPRATLEAAASGVPVIATALPGALPSRNIVGPRDPVALARKIEAFLSNAPESADGAAKLQTVIREHFGVERTADVVEAVYRRVLGR